MAKATNKAYIILHVSSRLLKIELKMAEIVQGSG